MTIAGLKLDTVYIVKSTKDETFNIGDYVWVSNTSPNDLNCVEACGWLDADALPNIGKAEFEEAKDWFVETDKSGSRAFIPSKEWIEKKREYILANS